MHETSSALRRELGLVILAIACGALIAACCGLSSAQLAASYPVSGGNRWLTPLLGFAGYLLALGTLTWYPWRWQRWRVECGLPRWWLPG